ncbi:MAG: hypothetical protein PHP44_05735 [Kiritimatiellae bacterium]|nr:hypothetical protein [Kiritimatiellia bacterium]
MGIIPRGGAAPGSAFFQLGFLIAHRGGKRLSNGQQTAMHHSFSPHSLFPTLDQYLITESRGKGHLAIKKKKVFGNAK